MISSQIYFLVVLLMLILPTHSINYVETLSRSECRAYFASDDVNKNLQALFSCPKKWRPPTRSSRFNRHILFANGGVDDDEQK
ncbi:unnamed protein product [Adineta steineri]|uniref:Uncharacterized protein n=1 Tax=Adineta steineri TaxID=433720 RepID=A0A814BP36_9BILA|nr:unnamed protein product [Adineta steineri]CAF3644162.1 unnamed protein product [Adineta steineri]